MNPMSNFNYSNDFETMNPNPKSEESRFASGLESWLGYNPFPNKKEAADRIKHAFENKKTELDLYYLRLFDIPPV